MARSTIGTAIRKPACACARSETRTPVWRRPLALATTLLLSLVSSPLLFAGEANVVSAGVTALGDGRYRIDTTVRHGDKGWDHYADRWDVVSPDGKVLGSRVLAHPHVEEQPFTRSLTITIPANVKRITLIAHDSVHGTGGAEVELDVPN